MRIGVSILLLTVTACQGAQTKHNSSADSDPLCRTLPGEAETLNPTKSGIQYFPPSFGKVMHVCNFTGHPECFPKVSSLKNEWYSRHWEAAGEPSLYQVSKADPRAPVNIVRFTWLPSFHHPVIVRFETTAGSITMTAKELSGMGGYDPGTIGRQITRTLNATEARQLTEAMTKRSPFEEAPEYCDVGTDGSQWMLERVNKGAYDYADRWTPGNGAMHDFGMLALKLTGWKFEKIY